MTSYPELAAPGDRARVSPWLATKMQDLIKGGCHKRLPQTKKQCELFPQSSVGKMKRKYDCDLFLHKAVSSHREEEVWKPRRQEELSLSRGQDRILQV